VHPVSRLDWAVVEQRLLPERPAALRTAASILGQRQLAEDAVQEALVRAAVSLASLKDQAALAPWFRRIVVRKALRLAGRRTRERPIDAPWAPDWSPPPEEGLESAGDRAQARRALATLSAPLRAAAALRYGLGLSVAESAAILGVPPGTIKSRCAAARRLLRQRFDCPLAEVLGVVDGQVRMATEDAMRAMVG
jgi:RNA polymerase sigma-70 factor (ECF subfamily)